ncbi:hypothetical protein HBI56_118330 [Parastagonospora nodorum]|uniref:Uncharacterized protein n=1 Tax=Phaeosphaeria nodorum (strain SN15 / ATCC MYA-4574 / FGSC 10173) TaxID=321614 RepID=A0A7U2FC04_PHANO|nr:hypothetical protein HBH56_056440 [Parastagonospora nodorum]QRD02476.1 hypothetical protein JI435_418050 [Parastagonospora nodorum SN15]KAH3921104.1 hypothetical protein HBH54_245810 [Parastagonospora nodorum]KAH3956431.1 hypothetical protein HBH51_242210 [Parastagonospora nodorum]KAH3988963.1 hypothetical protein HBH52_030850 [Parastagonospora nodorum]
MCCTLPQPLPETHPASYTPDQPATLHRLLRPTTPSDLEYRVLLRFTAVRENGHVGDEARSEWNHGGRKGAV